MSSYTTAEIRNVLIVGHVGSGKTSLVDAMLFASGEKKHPGHVADGTSFSDFDKQEIEHKHSIVSTILHCNYKGKRINLIDTPGAPDLVGSAIACLPAVETVAIVMNATSGIEVISRKMMEMARELNLPRAIIINKMDLAAQEPGRIEKLVALIRETFGTECIPVNLPSGASKSVVDCLLNSQGKTDFDTAKLAHARILDQIVEMDDNLLEKYLGGEEPDYQALHQPFEKAMDAAHVVPIVFTDAKNGVGVTELLDLIADYFPSPLEGNQRPFMVGEGEGDKTNERAFVYANDPNKSLLAHVFKTTSDPFVGKMSIFRVLQGKLTGQSQVFIGHNKKAVKLGHIFHISGKEHNQVYEVIAGDIGAVARMDDLHWNDVLHDDHALDSVHHKPLNFPTPMYSLALIPKVPGEDVKISGQLQKIADEDRTFTWHVDKHTHELVISCLGELHLKLVLERLLARGIHVDTKPPKINYRETVLSNAEGHHRHKKQTGGSGQFGEVFLRVEPLPSDSPSATANGGSGYEFVDEIFGGSIPGQYVPAVEKGVKGAMEHGVISGYPVQDIRVTVYDGKHHPVDSKDVAFRAAGKWAFIEAFKKARPALLEPIVSMEVIVPEDKLGIVTGDLSGKRGRIHATNIMSGGLAKVMAEVPMVEVMQYQNQLKSVTGGKGSFIMDFARYDPAPAHIADKVTDAFTLVEDE